MRSLIAVVVAGALLFAASSMAAPQPDPSPTTYWQIRGCAHHHREHVARNHIIDILTSPAVLTRHRWRSVWHFTVCVKYRQSHLRLRHTVKKFMHERRSNIYALLFARYPSWVHSKLASIAACESGGSPTAIGGGGAYRGKYQFSFSTWGVVGGSGDPAAASESEQDYRAAKLLTEHGAGHWPVCGA